MRIRVRAWAKEGNHITAYETNATSCATRETDKKDIGWCHQYIIGQVPLSHSET